MNIVSFYSYSYTYPDFPAVIVGGQSSVSLILFPAVPSFHLCIKKMHDLEMLSEQIVHLCFNLI